MAFGVVLLTETTKDRERVITVCCLCFTMERKSFIFIWDKGIRFDIYEDQPHAIMSSSYLIPDDTILDFPYLKAFADNNLKLTQRTNFMLDIVENIVFKGENNGYQHFPLFSNNVFKRFLCQGH